MLPTTSHEIRRPGELGKIYLLSLGISTPCYKPARSAQRGFFKSNEQGCTCAATVNTRHPAHGQDAAAAKMSHAFRRTPIFILHKRL